LKDEAAELIPKKGLGPMKGDTALLCGHCREHKVDRIGYKVYRCEPGVASIGCSWDVFEMKACSSCRRNIEEGRKLLVQQ
ncbi:MAG: hypothetical protein ACRCZO_00940, partial [Cetobacterium sp.]